MRLWHMDLIPVLPRQQLIAQYRECCAIARNIAVNGTPNHILVNKVLEYPMVHFCAYIDWVIMEMHTRGYRKSQNSYLHLIENLKKAEKYFYQGKTDCTMIVFSGWHNDRYLRQCYYNLQEKFDCGGISYDEWRKIEQAVEVEE